MNPPTRDYHTATNWRRPRPSGAAEPPPCCLCGQPTDRVADCDLPALPAVPPVPPTATDPGHAEIPAVPPCQAWHVPICPACYGASNPQPPAGA